MKRKMINIRKFFCDKLLTNEKKKIRKDWLERPPSKSPYLQENSWKSKKKRWNNHHKRSHEWSYKWLIPINRMRSHFYLEKTKTAINIRFWTGTRRTLDFSIVCNHTVFQTLSLMYSHPTSYDIFKQSNWIIWKISCTISYIYIICI